MRVGGRVGRIGDRQRQEFLAIDPRLAARPQEVRETLRVELPWIGDLDADRPSTPNGHPE